MFHDNHSLLQLNLLFFRRLLLALQTLQGENSCPAIFSHFIILYFLFLLHSKGALLPLGSLFVAFFNFAQPNSSSFGLFHSGSDLSNLLTSAASSFSATLSSSFISSMDHPDTFFSLRRYTLLPCDMRHCTTSSGALRITSNCPGFPSIPLCSKICSSSHCVAIGSFLASKSMSCSFAVHMHLDGSITFLRRHRNAVSSALLVVRLNPKFYLH